MTSSEEDTIRWKDKANTKWLPSTQRHGSAAAHTDHFPSHTMFHLTRPEVPLPILYTMHSCHETMNAICHKGKRTCTSSVYVRFVHTLLSKQPSTKIIQMRPWENERMKTYGYNLSWSLKNVHVSVLAQVFMISSSLCRARLKRLFSSNHHSLLVTVTKSKRKYDVDAIHFPCEKIICCLCLEFFLFSAFR